MWKKYLSFLIISVSNSVSALLVSHHPTGRSLSLHQQHAVGRGENEDTHAFLRFSPLIGGPPFLPLHVEVIFAVEDANCSEKIKSKMDTVYVTKNNNLSSTPILNNLLLHRFDFLPENPTDPSTLARLSTLQGVPGRVRHRTCDQRYSEEPNNIQITGSNDRQQDGRGLSILVPIGSLSCADDEKAKSNNVIISTAIDFKDEYSSTIKELRILGGKNCLSLKLSRQMKESVLAWQEAARRWRWSMARFLLCQAEQALVSMSLLRPPIPNLELVCRCTFRI